jgi:hypothetical protein
MATEKEKKLRTFMFKELDGFLLGDKRLFLSPVTHDFHKLMGFTSKKMPNNIL